MSTIQTPTLNPTNNNTTETPNTNTENVPNEEEKKEEVKVAPKKVEKKMDMMTELRLRMQERENKKKGIVPATTNAPTGNDNSQETNVK